MIYFVKELMSLTPGSISPFGLLNDENLLVHFYIDKDYDDSIIGIHTNDNTETIKGCQFLIVHPYYKQLHDLFFHTKYY